MTNPRWFALDKDKNVIPGQPTEGFRFYEEAYTFATESGVPGWSIWRQD